MQITYAVEEAVTTQRPPRRCVRPPGLLLFLSAGRYYGAACRGSQYAGRRSARTAAVNQHPEVAGTDCSEPSSAGTRPLPQPPPPPPPPPRRFTVSLAFLPLRNAAASCRSRAHSRANLHIRPQTACVFAALALDSRLRLLPACFSQPKWRRDAFHRLRPKSERLARIMADAGYCYTYKGPECIKKK